MDRDMQSEDDVRRLVEMADGNDVCLVPCGGTDMTPRLRTPAPHTVESNPLSATFAVD